MDRAALERCERVRALCAEIRAQRPTARCWGYLRVRSGGRTRELILGAGSLIAGTAVLLDWEQAPLAEVFLAHEIGDEYDLELDERHAVEGTVLDRAILRSRDGELVEIDDGEQCLVQDGDAWTPTRSRLQPPMPLRERSERSSRGAAFSIEVELDELQRHAVEVYLLYDEAIEPGESLKVVLRGKPSKAGEYFDPFSVAMFSNRVFSKQVDLELEVKP